MQAMGQQWQRVGGWFVMVGCCLLLLFSCGQTRSNDPSHADRVIIGTIAAASTLDPADAYGFWAGNLLYNLGDRLYTYKLGSTDLVPQLATALPTVSTDGLTYTIPLRQGVVFHDGTPFNAEAMAFSLRRFMENAGSPSFLLSDLIDTVKATNDTELTITLKRPFVAFPSLLAFSGACAVSPAAYEIGEGKFKPKAFVGTGAYKLVQVGTTTLRLDAFDQYWGEKPLNRGIDIQRFSSPANLYLAFKSGNIDVAYQTLDIDQALSLQRLAAQRGWQVIPGQGIGVYYLTLNLRSPPLDRLDVRQAIAAAIDRPLLQQRVFRGQVEPLYSLIPPTLSGQRGFKDRYGDGNVSLVRELLSRAGYSASNPLTVELWYRSNLITNQLAASTIQAAVKLTMGGIMAIDIKGVDSATAYQNLDKGIYPMFMLDWSGDFLDADSYLQPFVECTEGSPTTGCTAGSSALQGSFYYSDTANRLIAQTRKTTDPSARQQLIRQLEDLVTEEVPFIPLWQTKDYLFVQRWIQGGQLSSTTQVPFWTLQKSAHLTSTPPRQRGA
jgi:peptide/nickel transport system substrate-binding protein